MAGCSWGLLRRIKREGPSLCGEGPSHVLRYVLGPYFLPKGVSQQIRTATVNVVLLLTGTSVSFIAGLMLSDFAELVPCPCGSAQV